MNIEANQIYLMDCLEGMRHIPDKSVDMILCDLPYGVTTCKWDSIISFDLLWQQYERIIKPQASIVLTSIEPFTSKLILSNINKFKYKIIWEKSRVQHFAQAPYRFLTITEDICIFSAAGCSKNSKVRMTYNPQNIIKIHKKCKGKGHSDHRPSKRTQKNYTQQWTNYPKNIIKIASDKAKEHPTQKPVALFEYLIKTYTDEGDTVLDNCMGSGTTAIACLNTNRKYIGFEKEQKYFDIAQERIKKHLEQHEHRSP